MDLYIDEEKEKYWFHWFGVKEYCDLQELRAKFKIYVLKHHPDRGGDANTFDQIRKVYMYLYKILLSHQQQKSKENRKLDEYIDARNKDVDPGTQQTFPNMNDFHENFAKLRTKNLYDNGRELFLKQKVDNTRKRNQIAIISKPDIYSANFISNLPDINATKVDDYSTYVNRNKNKREIACFDLQHAYEEKPILQGNMANTREDQFLNDQTNNKYAQHRSIGNTKLCARQFTI